MFWSEFRNSKILKNLHIRFNRETFLNDLLICTTCKTDIPDTYTHVIEKDGVSVCDILTTWSNSEDKDNIVDYNLDIKNLDIKTKDFSML